MAILTDQQAKKKRTFLLIAPVLVVPFLTLIFWSLGGGTGQANASIDNPSNPGINTHLPEAQNKNDESLDKMGFYELADQDSVKREEALRNDPYAQSPIEGDSSQNNIIIEEAAQEKEIYSKLKEIDKQLASNAASNSVPNYRTHEPATITGDIGDVDRLEQLLVMSQQKNTDVDSETVVLNSMLEKILDIQHPDRVREKIQQTSKENKGMVLPVLTTSQEDIFATESGNPSHDTSRFENVIPAQIAESRELYAGATIKLRLLSDVYIGGSLIVRNSFVSGIVSFSDSRLLITVSSILSNRQMFPVELAVHDNKGILGLELQANIQHELARQSGQRGTDGINMSSFDPSIGGQALATGVEVAKNIISKKFRQIKVPVTAGVPVLLISTR